MRKILSLILFSLPLQGGGQSVNILIPTTSFTLGYGQSLSQDLHITPLKIQGYGSGYAHEGIYTISFSPENSFTNYPGYPIMELYYGTQELCSPPSWGIDTNSTVAFMCSSPGYLLLDHSISCEQSPCTIGPVQSNSDLVLTTTVRFWPVKVTNVSLTFTPTN